MVGEPIAPAVRLVAVITGACAALFAIVAYVFPQPVAANWPWAISPLMVRVFISWLSAFAVSLLWFAVERDWSRVRPLAALLVGSAALMLLMLLLHRADVKPGAVAVWPFGAGIVGIGLLGAFMFWRQREPADRPRSAAAQPAHRRSSAERRTGRAA